MICTEGCNLFRCLTKHFTLARCQKNAPILKCFILNTTRFATKVDEIGSDFVIWRQAHGLVKIRDPSYKIQAFANVG